MKISVASYRDNKERQTYLVAHLIALIYPLKFTSLEKKEVCLGLKTFGTVSGYLTKYKDGIVYLKSNKWAPTDPEAEIHRIPIVKVSSLAHIER